MTTHDPKHTAFALGELSPAERAEIERELSADPELGAEITEIKEMAGILKTELATEPAGTLAEHQRWAIIRAATPARPLAANERDAVEATWWQRAGVWQVVAACAVFGFGVYTISQQFTLPSGPKTADNGKSGDVIVSTSPDVVPTVMPDPIAMGTPEVPEILTVAEAQSRIAKGGANLDAAKIFPNGVFIPPPSVAEQLAVGGVNEIAMRNLVKQEEDKIVFEFPTKPKVATGGPRRPTPVGQNPTLANADRGSYAAQAVTEVRSLVKEAEGFGKGTTYGEFRKLFGPVTGMSNLYQLNRFSLIQVDAEFVGADGTPITGQVPDDALIKSISKPYVGNRIAQ